MSRKKDGSIIFNARITEDQYVAVSGIFYIGSKKIHITDRIVEINGTPRQTINGVDMHNTIFVGTCNITLTDDEVRI